MHKFTFHIFCFLSCLLILLPSTSYPLERDYYRWHYPLFMGDQFFQSSELCYDCINDACGTWDMDLFLSEYKKEFHGIPSASACIYCGKPTIYTGYIHFRYKGDYLFLKRQIAYSKKYPHYQAYWPETSQRAEKISDVAVTLFEDLISSTALEEVGKNENLYDNFITDSWYYTSLNYYLSRSLVVFCFRFSDFYQVCKDLILFSETYFSKEESALIEDKTDAILDQLCPMFLELYEESLSLHPTEEIQMEIEFINLLYNYHRTQEIEVEKDIIPRSQFSIKEYNPCKYLLLNDAVNNSNSLPDWLLADYWLCEGTKFNDLFLHAEAVTYLTAAIKKKPSIEAYRERLHAYFEMGNLALAIEDYNSMQQLASHKNNLLFPRCEYTIQDLNDTMEYSGGFCIGIAQGSTLALTDFVPSTWSCCKGILHALWALTCSPLEVSNDLIDASYDLVKFIKENTTKDCLETIIPELKELCANWDQLSNYEKGAKTGYVVGKYGIDILIPGTTLKGIKKYQQLKRLNSTFTVECCITSEAKKAKILEASSKYAAARSSISELAKTGKIIPSNANVIPHVMQEKHAWEKLIKISGNSVLDFEEVANLLQENQILKNGKKTFLGTFFKEREVVHRYQYTMEIRGHAVEAHFIEYLSNNQSLLTNAWVTTR